MISKRWMGNKRKGAMLLLMMLLAVAAGGCAAEKPADSRPDETAEQPGNSGGGGAADVQPAEEPAEEPGNGAAAAFTAPLTGLGREMEAAARPIAVMINNFPKARPQSGLPHADMVWEVLAEGGITRLVAIFQSEEDDVTIGPVRSIRPYLIDLGDTFRAVLAHAGGSNDAYAILQRQKKPDLDEIGSAGAYFWRDKSRKAPHNLYTSLPKLRDGAADKGYASGGEAPAFTFAAEGAADAVAAGAAAEHVELTFLLKSYKVSYDYDPNTKTYGRFINGEPHTDLTSSEQLSASNLVVIGAKHRTYDDYGRLEIDLQAGGPAVLFQFGRAVECRWVRGVDDVIRIEKDGVELPFVPGKTYYHIVPMSPNFESHLLYR
ncbi:hypothetical protein VN24_06755 [Paenibacillus beijingensis]|uniref:Lipoprotein YerB n=2 Tax=Paenibacillus beijingensis TaxID=1126833 RepID=A0A0D5NRN2_9BACL|nr:hypothetical protein VN24_06755 [Paenibacillus beijingensis]